MKILITLFMALVFTSACASNQEEVTVQDSGEVAELESMMDAPAEDAMSEVEGYPYENTDYGFSMTFPESMKNFVITPRAEQISQGNDEKILAVSLANYDIGFEGEYVDSITNIPRAFMNVSVYKIADWDALMAEKARAPFLVQSTEVARNEDYVFTMSRGHDLFPEGIDPRGYEALRASFRVE